MTFFSTKINENQDKSSDFFEFDLKYLAFSNSQSNTDLQTHQHNIHFELILNSFLLQNSWFMFVNNQPARNVLVYPLHCTYPHFVVCWLSPHACSAQNHRRMPSFSIENPSFSIEESSFSREESCFLLKVSIYIMKFHSKNAPPALLLDVSIKIVIFNTRFIIFDTKFINFKTNRYLYEIQALYNTHGDTN